MSEVIIGLARGLLYAGARSLVVSQWNVNDASTPALLSAFYFGREVKLSVASWGYRIELVRTKAYRERLQGFLIKNNLKSKKQKFTKRAKRRELISH